MYYLLVYKDDYADEFDIEGFRVLNEKQLADWSEALSVVCSRMRPEVVECQDITVKLMDGAPMQTKNWVIVDEGSTFYYHFGTNEYIEYEEPEDLARCFSIITLGKEIPEYISRLVNSYMEFGHIPYDQIMDDAYNMEEDEE